MVTMSVQKLAEDIAALTADDLKKVAINLPKPKKGDIRVGQLPDELKRLFTLNRRAARESRKAIAEHNKVCAGGQGTNCMTFHSEAMSKIKDLEMMDIIFRMLFRREFATQGVCIGWGFEVYIPREACEVIEISIIR